MTDFSFEGAVGAAPKAKGDFSFEEAHGLDAPTPERGPIVMQFDPGAPHGLRGRARRWTAQ
jgi:hypothetical protein